jgi:hypothetical protein
LELILVANQLLALFLNQDGDIETYDLELRMRRQQVLNLVCHIEGLGKTARIHSHWTDTSVRSHPALAISFSVSRITKGDSMLELRRTIASAFEAASYF